MSANTDLGPNGYQARLQRREDVAPLVASMWVIPFSSKPRRSSYYSAMPAKPTRMAAKLVKQYLYFYKSNTTQPIDFRINLDRFVRVQLPSKNKTVPREVIPQGALDVLCSDHSVTLAPDTADLKRATRLFNLIMAWRSKVQEGEFDVWKKKVGDWLRHTLLLSSHELIITRRGVLDDQKLRCALADVVEIKQPSQRLTKIPGVDTVGTIDIRIQQPSKRGDGLSTSTMTLRARGALTEEGSAKPGGVEEQILNVLLHLHEDEEEEEGEWTSLELEFAANESYGLGMVIVRAVDGGIEHLKVQQLRRCPDGSPGAAELAGVRVNDIITAVNHQVVSTVPGLIQAMKERQALGGVDSQLVHFAIVRAATEEDVAENGSDAAEPERPRTGADADASEAGNAGAQAEAEVEKDTASKEQAHSGEKEVDAEANVHTNAEAEPEVTTTAIGEAEAAPAEDALRAAEEPIPKSNEGAETSALEHVPAQSERSDIEHNEMGVSEPKTELQSVNDSQDPGSETIPGSAAVVDSETNGDSLSAHDRGDVTRDGEVHHGGDDGDGDGSLANENASDKDGALDEDSASEDRGTSIDGDSPDNGGTPDDGGVSEHEGASDDDDDGAPDNDGTEDKDGAPDSRISTDASHNTADGNASELGHVQTDEYSTRHSESDSVTSEMSADTTVDRQARYNLQHKFLFVNSMSSPSPTKYPSVATLPTAARGAELNVPPGLGITAKRVKHVRFAGLDDEAAAPTTHETPPSSQTSTARTWKDMEELLLVQLAAARERSHLPALEAAIAEARAVLPADHRYIAAAESARAQILAGRKGPFPSPSPAHTSDNETNKAAVIAKTNETKRGVVSSDIIRATVKENMVQKLTTTIRETRFPNQLSYLSSVVREASTLLDAKHPLFLRARLTSEQVLKKHGKYRRPIHFASSLRRTNAVANPRESSNIGSMPQLRPPQSTATHASFGSQPARLGTIQRSGAPSRSGTDHGETRVVGTGEASQPQQHQASNQSTIVVTRPPGSRQVDYRQQDGATQRRRAAQEAVVTAVKSSLSLHHFPVHGQYYSYHDLVDMQAFLVARAEHIMQERRSNQGWWERQGNGSDSRPRQNYSTSRAARVSQVLARHKKECDELLQLFRRDFAGVDPDKKILKYTWSAAGSWSPQSAPKTAPTNENCEVPTNPTLMDASDEATAFNIDALLAEVQELKSEVKSVERQRILY